jgi:hypothetical protein
MKRTLFILAALLLPVLSFTQTATVSGVVTYFFNKYQGDKPDLGAKVYLVDSTKAPFFNQASIDSFMNARRYRIMQLEYLNMEAEWLSMGKKRFKDHAAEMRKSADEFKHKLDSLGLGTDGEFNQLATRVAMMGAMLNESNSIRRTVDGSGNYSVTARPGKYYLYIESKNRQGSSVAEVMGKIYSKGIVLKEGDAVDVSYNFDLY